MARTSSTDLQSALSRFLADNPDLPQGPADEPVAEPKSVKPRLDVMLDRKGRAGKTATIIAGFDPDSPDADEVAAVLKRRLATGGSARGGEILIQGDRRKQVVDILASLGYKARII